MRRVLFAIAVAMMLMVAAPAYAGGWTVTSFDELPAEFVAGDTYELSYLIMQHGVAPIDVASTAVTLRSEATGEEEVFRASSAGETGRYMVEVTVPSSGSWTWTVSQGLFGVQELGELTVVSAEPTTSSALGLLRVLLPLTMLIAVAVLALQLNGLRQGRGQEPLPARTGVGAA